MKSSAKFIYKTSQSSIRDDESAPNFLKLDGNDLRSFSDKVKDDESMVLIALEQNGMSLKYASDRLKDDKNLVFKAIEYNPLSIKYASDRLKNDDDLVLKAIVQNPQAIEYASERIRNDKKLSLFLVRTSVENYSYLSEKMQADKDIVLYTIGHGNPGIYSSLPRELISDIEVATLAVRKYRNNLIYAPESLRDNEEIVLNAFEHDNYFLNIASKRLLDDFDFIMKAMDRDFSVGFNYLSVVSDRLIYNKQIILRTLRNTSLLESVPPEFKNDREIAELVLGNDGKKIYWFSDEIKNDRSFAELAVYNDADAYRYISTNLKNNRYIILEAIDSYNFNNSIFNEFPEEYKDDIEIVKQSIEKHPSIYQDISKDLKKNKEIAILAMGDEKNYRELPLELRHNIDFAILAYRKNQRTLFYIPDEIKKDPNFRILALPETENAFYHSENQQYQSLKGKFLTISSEIISLQEILSTEQNPNEKMKINNRIGKLNSQIIKLKQWSAMNKVMSEEEIDSLLMDQSDKSRPFNSVIKTWGKGYGQNFANSEEKVILLYWDRELYKELIQDPIIEKFITHEPRFKHFFEGSTPVGWALVYEKDVETWVINQIQSDLMSDFRHILNDNIDKKNDTPKITSEELFTRLNANERGGYWEILNQNVYRDILTRMMINPDTMFEFPPAKNEEEANHHINEIQIAQNNLVNQGVAEVGVNEKLDELSGEQLSYIEDKLSWLINSWPNMIFQNVWMNAKKNGIKNLYMNSSKTVSGGLSEDASRIMYESYPKSWGFEKVNVDLRGIGDESMWYRKANIFNLHSMKIAQSKTMHFKYFPDYANDFMMWATKVKRILIGEGWNPEEAENIAWVHLKGLYPDGVSPEEAVNHFKDGESSVKVANKKFNLKKYKTAQNQGPIIAFHGSRSTGITSFDKNLIGTGIVSPGKRRGEEGAFWFTSSFENAMFYTDPVEIEGGEFYIPEENYQVYGDGPYYSLLYGDDDNDINLPGSETESEADQLARDMISKNNDMFEKNETGVILSVSHEDLVYKVSLDIKHPYILEGNIYPHGHMGEIIEFAKQNGYDGVMVKDYVDGAVMSDIYAIFDPNQVTILPKTNKFAQKKNNNAPKILYHISPENFNTFSANHTGAIFDVSKRFGLKGIFLSPNLQSAQQWAPAIANGKSNNDEIYRTLYLYKVATTKGDYERWKNIQRDTKGNPMLFALEVFVPEEDLNKLKIVGKEKYRTRDLLELSKRNRSPMSIEDLYEYNPEKIKKIKEDEAKNTPNHFDNVMNLRKEINKKFPTIFNGETEITLNDVHYIVTIYKDIVRLKPKYLNAVGRFSEMVEMSLEEFLNTLNNYY